VSTCTAEEVKAYLESVDSDALLCDGFDEAIIGVVHVPCRGEVVLYDSNRMIEILVEGHDLDWGQAVEHLEYNTWNAHAGPGTPVFMVDLFER
jgi:hypothetical protein